MEEVYVLCSVCEEAYRCTDALIKDGCDLGIKKPREHELSDKNFRSNSISSKLSDIY